MRISFRLALAFLGVVLAVFAFQAYLSIRWHAGLYRTDVQRDLRVMGHLLAPAVITLWREEGLSRALALVTEANEHKAETRIRWVFLDRAAGEPDAPEVGPDLRRLRGGEEVAFLADDRELDPRVYLYVPTILPGEPPAAVELSESLAGQRAYVQSRVARNAFTALAMLISCALISYALGDRLVGRPVRALVAKARRIAREDFSGPLELPARGELSELAREVNAMSASLEAARRRVDDETAARITAIEQLRHADRLTTVGRLAAGIAHELGTPLNVISERSKMIAGGELTSAAEAAASAGIIHQQAARLTAIVRQLLDFARRRRPERTRTNLGDLTQSTFRLVEPLFARRGVAMHLEVPETPVWCEVDAGQIQQVLANLLTNAADATKRGGVVRVRVQPGPGSPELRGGFARIDVEDEGSGIPEEVLPQIFDPFFTTKPVGEGTGLGLAVADGIVREHGGRIEVQSDGCTGSRFSVWLPGEVR
jgi:signal transduction histidine kinase